MTARAHAPFHLAAIALAAAGLVLVTLALGAHQAWLDRHFLPSFFVPRHWYVAIETGVRVAIGAAGSCLVLGARRLGPRMTAPATRRVVEAAAAAVLALWASEQVLRRVHVPPAEWLIPTEEPRRRPDPRLGWVFVPDRAGRSAIGGRTVEYALDRAGYRVRHVDEPVDLERPAILFIGESVMFGEGLTWEESVPAQVGAMLHVQGANLAVHGYSSDQAYLRLQTELPRFHRPAAVVGLFMTALFGRNLDDDRPHLALGPAPEPVLMWRPAVSHGRLISLAALLVPFRRSETVERGIATTREVLRAMAALARTRGAAPLIVVPHFGPEDDVELALRGRMLDESTVPYVLVEINPTWHLPWDRHPNAQAARLMANAIAERLRRKSSARDDPEPDVERVLDRDDPAHRDWRDAVRRLFDGKSSGRGD